MLAALLVLVAEGDGVSSTIAVQSVELLAHGVCAALVLVLWHLLAA